MTKELLQQALEALEPFVKDAARIDPGWSSDRRRNSLTQDKPLTVGHFREAQKVCAAIEQALAQQEQPAQEPAETVTLVGIKDGIETVLGTVSTPPEMKAREIIRNYGWNPDDQDDFGEGETAMCIINDLLAWMRRQGAPKIELAAPTQPALTQEQAEKLAHRRATTYTHRNDLYATPYAFNPVHLMDFVRDIEAHCRGGCQAASVDAYVGAREDAAIWKKRALEAEELNRKFIADVNGSTYLGEPVKQEQPAQKVSESWTDIVAVNLVREGVNKHKARELAAHFLTLFAPPTQPALSDDEILNCFYASKSEGMASYMLAVGRAIEAHCRGGVNHG